jgi:hypothetical protein
VPGLDPGIIPNAFGEKAVLKLMYGAMTRAAERWRGVTVTAFERRQLEAVKAELDAEYQTSIGRPPAAPPAQDFQRSDALTVCERHQFPDPGGITPARPQARDRKAGISTVLVSPSRMSAAVALPVLGAFRTPQTRRA